jgi:hypothetical protein
MKQRTRCYFSQTELAGIWDRWENGDSLNAIGCGLGWSHSTVQGALSGNGDNRSTPKRRSGVALSLAEREEISRGIAMGPSIRTIASQLCRAPSTVGWEINGNGGRRCYRANHDDEVAWERAGRAKTCKLAQHPVLARVAAEKLIDW